MDSLAQLEKYDEHVALTANIAQYVIQVFSHVLLSYAVY